MLEIRRMVVDGYSYEHIQRVTGLSKRTFYRYLKHVFEDDKQVLEQENHAEVMRQVVILNDRYNKILRYIEAIATDPKVKAYDRIQALAAMKELSDAIARLHRDAPALSVVQRRKLEAIKKGPLLIDTTDRLRLPPVFDSSPPPTTEPPTTAEHSEEEKEEEYP